MSFKIENEQFILNDKKVFLNSGEIHYFRIKRATWDIHLKAAKEAGLDVVSSYVPWAWHEATEGIFDFDGNSCPERDLTSWISLCEANGLKCILKPGPFILAEYRGAGLPDWFMEKHGQEVKMHNSQGTIVQSDGVSLFHPVFLEKVTAWYDAIMPFIRDRQISRGGPVIMMQVCNEIGVFSWLAHQADYSETVRQKYIAYLKKNFTGPEEINRLWETDYDSFDQIGLPPDGRDPYTSVADRGRDFEWHRFWRTYYGDYLRMLTRMIRDRGVDLQLYHNLPGWIYGNGYEFPVNITMYEDLFDDRSEIIFGIDHIPEFVSYRNLHDDRIINDITHAMQGHKPLFAAEFQCGSREYHVVTNSREMELFYKASIAHGLKGWNYYMFSQGKNPRQKGYSGSTFYWFNPLTHDGEKTNVFPLVKRMNQLVKTAENVILNADRKAEICVLFYPHYYATELERPMGSTCQIRFDYSKIRRSAYFDGILKVLQVLNADFDMADLSKNEADKLAKYKQIWVFATDEMNASDQQKLVDYTRNGGRLIIFPSLPDRQMNGQACTILRDALNIHPIDYEVIDSPLIDILGHEDIKCANPQAVYDENDLSPAEVIARNVNGHVCGFTKILGKGNVIHLGTWMGFDTEGHKPVYEELLQNSGARIRRSGSDHEFLIARERFTPQGQAMLFIANYYNETHPGKVWYTHPETGEMVTIPFMEERSCTWPALYGVLSPVNLTIAPKLRMLHSTSDLLEINYHQNEILISIYGDRDLEGEMVFEGEAISDISQISFDEQKQDLFRSNGKIVLFYRHKHQETSVIKVEMNKP